MEILRLRTCALRNLEMVLTCYAIPRLPAQSLDSENAQIPRLRGTYTLFNYKPPSILVANKKGGGGGGGGGYNVE